MPGFTGAKRIFSRSLMSGRLSQPALFWCQVLLFSVWTISIFNAIRQLNKIMTQEKNPVIVRAHVYTCSSHSWYVYSRTSFLRSLLSTITFSSQLNIVGECPFSFHLFIILLGSRPVSYNQSTKDCFTVIVFQLHTNVQRSFLNLRLWLVQTSV